MRDTNNNTDEEIKWLENSISSGTKAYFMLIPSILTFGVMVWVFLYPAPVVSLKIVVDVVSLILCVLYMKQALPRQVGLSRSGIYAPISKINNWKKFVSWDDIVSISPPNYYDDYQLTGLGKSFFWVSKGVRDELEHQLRKFLKEKERNAFKRAKTGWDEKIRRGKLLFASWPKRRKLIIRISFTVIIISGIVFVFFYIRMVLSFASEHADFPYLDFLHDDAFYIAGFDLLLMVLVLFLYAIESKEFRIYNNYILFPEYPKPPVIRQIPFSKISHIELNTHQQDFIPEVEIVLKDGTVQKYDKTKIHDWDDFYRVMLKEVGEKVMVVE